MGAGAAALYYTERVLARSASLAPLGALGGLHHERLDGSGYHRGVAATALGAPARVLAAADAYHPMTEPRPHRDALAPERTADELRREVRRPARRGRRRRGAAHGGAPGAAPARVAGEHERSRGRGAAADRPGAAESGDRRGAGDLRGDGGGARAAHLRQDRRGDSRRGDAIRDAARAARADRGGHLAAVHAAIPDFKLVEHDAVAEGDLVATRWTVHGTHRGRLGRFSPTGRRLEIAGISIYRVANGRIVEGWVPADTMALLARQAAEAPAAAGR